MNLRIYLIVEEGADRVYVCGTAYPTYYKKPADRRAEIVAVDIPLPDVEVDRVVKLGPELVSPVGSSGVIESKQFCFCTCGAFREPARVDPNMRWRHTGNCPHGYG